jgi:hypothetical protein
MWLRKILMTAAVAAPLALSPVQASAQQGGGPEAREQAHQYGGQTVTQLPPGIAQKVEQGGAVPEGIDRRYSPPAVPEAEPEPEPECTWVPAMRDGVFGTENTCTGEFIAF